MKRPTSTLLMRVRELSEVTPSLADPYGAEPTPLAQAAEHMLLARQGAQLRRPLGSSGGDPGAWSSPTRRAASGRRPRP